MSGKIILDGLQIKNIEKAKKLAYAINMIEEECGIKSVSIEFKNMFICDWIDFEKLNNTEMEKLIKRIIEDE